ncbi:MAG: DUF1461 domain-containing protein [Proteobacteria bacterium]|nr:DUF1461 domain-containing protein [Pseudomonadota bacterium]
MKQVAKKTALFLSFFYLTLYIPVSFVIYTPYWYTLNCQFHGRCQMVGETRSTQGIRELVSFYRHGAPELESEFWTSKEKNHLSEVRHMTDTLFFMGLVALVLFFLCFEKMRLGRFAGINMAVVCLLVFILPFFPYFWRHIFHPLLFNNRNWLNTPKDFSFYILPRVFFKNTLIYLIIASCTINLLVFAFIRFNFFQHKTTKNNKPLQVRHL